METLPDFLCVGLRLLSIGLNPSLPSVRHGFYFANPRNRFWRAFNDSGLVEHALRPGVDAHEILLRRDAIGFTDVVKRPTAGASGLRAADYRQWAPILEDKILCNEPAIAWFHGKVAYQNYLWHTVGIKPDVDWGEQPLRVGETVVFVTPNPSPANAAYSLAALTGRYDQLAPRLGR